MRIIIFFLIISETLSINVFAANYFVDNIKGSDQNQGTSISKAFKTLRSAVTVLKPGDSLHLIKNNDNPYLENLILKNISGTSVKPIVIEGNGAVLCGSQEINPQLYTMIGNNIFFRDLDLKITEYKRFFLVVNNRLERMGRVLKSGRMEKFKSLNELLPNEWTYDVDQKRLYIKLSPGQDLKSTFIMEPDISLDSGVKISGSSSNLIIRDITVKFFWNDGYNLHGNCHSVNFYNIAAIANGDDGISAHETCEFSVDGFIADGNATGICHVNQSKATHSNVNLSNAAGVEIHLDNAANYFKNLEVRSSAPRGILVKSPIFEVENGKIIYEGTAKKSDIQTTSPVLRNFKIINGL